MAYLDKIEYNGIEYNIRENETFLHICDINFDGTATAINQSLSKDGYTSWKTIFIVFDTSLSSVPANNTSFMFGSGGSAAYILLKSSAKVGELRCIFLFNFYKSGVCTGYYSELSVDQNVSNIHIDSPYNKSFSNYSTNGGCSNISMSNTNAAKITNGTMKIYGIPA